MTSRNAVVVGGNRTPFVKAGGKYAMASAQDLMTAALDGLVARFGLSGQRVDEVVGGAVLKHTRDFNLKRESVLGSALSPLTPACDLQQACCTGLEAVVYASNKIKLGQAELAIAGGVDSASDAPIVVTESLRKALLALNRARSLPEKLAAIAKIRPGDLMPVPPGVVEPRTGLSMGESQALTTKKWGISREDQDELSLASHRNLAKAWDDGFFDDLVTPYLRVAKEGILRPDTTREALAKLRPVFGKGDTATMTAGNSTALTDGAAVVLLAEEEEARGRGWPVLATLAALEKNGTGVVDRAKLNVNGSSLAAGHPFAATGGRIVASLAKMLHERGSGAKGLISICAAGGMAVTAILEAV